MLAKRGSFIHPYILFCTSELSYAVVNTTIKLLAIWAALDIFEEHALLLEEICRRVILDKSPFVDDHNLVAPDDAPQAMGHDDDSRFA